MTAVRCSRPCPAISPGSDFSAIREHLAAGNRCVDSWLALARLVQEPDRRLDCLARASALDPADLELEIAYLEFRLSLDPGDLEADGALRAARARRALMGHKPRIFKHQDASPTLGSILVSMGALTSETLEWLLREQAVTRQRGEQIMFGDIAVARGAISAETLAQALMTQLRQRTTNDASPRALGEYLLADGLKPEYLERALAEQINLRRVGRRETLGAILLRMKLVSKVQLERALERQHHDSLSAFR